MQTNTERNIFDDLKLIAKGKIREIYDLEDKLLFYVSDRISAFDVIMNEVVDGKGKVLNLFSEYWFERTQNIIPNHFISSDIETYPEKCSKYSEQLVGRSMLVKKCKPLPVEFVVRGYIAGSGWKEYQNTGKICGNIIPKGLENYSKLDKPIFTPATKATDGHDENIDFASTCRIIGEDIAIKLRDISFKLFDYGTKELQKFGIILADTKFEFGVDQEGKLTLIDEVMTPDSSRFWNKDGYNAGQTPENYDKQILRDYLDSLDWNKTPPPPKLPQEIIHKTIAKYQELYKLLSTKNTNN